MSTPQKIILTLGLAVVAVAVLLFLRRGTVKPRDFKTTDKMMAYLSSQAIEMADKNFKIRLDYSVESIKQVDEILGKLHDEYVASKPVDGVNGLAMAYGAYIGEVIRKTQRDAKWQRDDPVGGQKSYPLCWNGHKSFVCAWAYKRIVNGDEDNVWFKYQVMTNEQMKNPV